MLNTLISSKTRLNLLIRFFLNLAKKNHLRGLANDFNESTNSIRLELNNLTKAGYLIKKKEKNKINYLANHKHPLFNILVNLVRKHTGIEEIVENIVSSIQNLSTIYLLGDYSKGILTYELEGKSYKLPSGYFKLSLSSKAHKKYLPYEGIGVTPDVFLEYSADWIEQTRAYIKK